MLHFIIEIFTILQVIKLGKYLLIVLRKISLNSLNNLSIYHIIYQHYIVNYYY